MVQRVAIVDDWMTGPVTKASTAPKSMSAADTSQYLVMVAETVNGNPSLTSVLVLLLAPRQLGVVVLEATPKIAVCPPEKLLE